MEVGMECLVLQISFLGHGYADIIISALMPRLVNGELRLKEVM